MNCFKKNIFVTYTLAVSVWIPTDFPEILRGRSVAENDTQACLVHEISDPKSARQSYTNYTVLIRIASELTEKTGILVPIAKTAADRFLVNCTF
jgi:hypothetical protein